MAHFYSVSYALASNPPLSVQHEDVTLFWSFVIFIFNDIVIIKMVIKNKQILSFEVN